MKRSSLAALVVLVVAQVHANARRQVLLETPVPITNTGSVGIVRDAAVAWMVQQKHGDFWSPVTAGTGDVPLNDIKGQHVTAQDAWTL